MTTSKNSNSLIASSSKPERDFGFLIASVLVFISAYKYYFQSWGDTQFIACILAVIGITAVVLLKPHLLRVPLRLWMQLGDLIGKFVSPLVLGIIFFCMITPIAVVARLFGRDTLRLKKNISSTFWINRDGSMQPSESFKTQF